MRLALSRQGRWPVRQALVVSGAWRQWHVGPVLIKSKFRNGQNHSNLIQTKTILPELENFGIKYEVVGFEAMNKYPYWNFNKFAK
jgi:hypothetical protein